MLSIVPAQISSLPAGSYSGNVTLNYRNSDTSSGTLTVPVTMNLQLPLMQTVSYYVATANVAGRVKLRGQNLDLASGSPALFGATAATRTAVDDPTQASVSFPGLAAGTYHVQFQNTAGVSRGSANLLVQAAQTMSYQAINAPSLRKRLIVDAERQALYAVNTTDQELEIYRYSGGTWTTDSPLVTPNFEDATLSPDGKVLVGASDNSMLEIDLTQASLRAQLTAANPDAFCGGYLNHVEMGNDGKYFVIYNYKQCSGFSPSYLYDFQLKTLDGAGAYPSNYFYNGLTGGAADGSRIYIGSNGVSPAQPVSFFNTFGGTLAATGTNNNLFAVSVSRDASRVILQQTSVYSAGLILLGNIPTTGSSVVSPDGTRAYAFANASGSTLEIYDLTAPLAAGANYPLLRSIALADDPGSTSLPGVVLAVSADGKTVFISGSNKILVVPVP
ncbi:hypothetical protein [Nevskia sp.]|uniref:hypothetical protein n=1 Tax=Nevskia sp. TaxID=1929292 RepID=UPI0025E46BEA|nr:hypothetical protein [Nevskia sp.]